MKFRLPILQKNAVLKDHTAQEIMSQSDTLTTPDKIQGQWNWG